MSAGTRRKKYVERALQGGALTLEIVKEVSNLAEVPYLPKVAGLVLKIFEIIEAVKDNKSGFTELAKDATNILSILLDYYDSRSAEAGPSEWLPDSLKDVVEKLTQTLVDTIDLANKNILRPIFFRVLSSKADTGDIAKLRLRIDVSLKAFEVQSHLGMNQKLSELMSVQLNKDAESKRDATLSRRTQVMKELGASIHRGAGFDASARSDIPKCTPQTREAIRKHIQNWIEHGNDTEQVMWLYGPAGSGKTTIGQTIAQLYYEEYQRLLASYFFSRSAGDSRPHTKNEFVVTIAFQLCISIPDLIDCVGTAIYDDAGIFNRDLPSQMQSLVINPLNKLLEDQMFHESVSKCWWLLLVDGLDECDSDAAQKEVLSLLRMLMQKTKLPLRILVASRPEHAIQSFMNSSMGSSDIQSLPLAVDYRANKDIEIHLLSEFDAIKRTHPASRDLPAAWPCYEDVQELVARSRGLFIYASVVMNYIKSEDSHPVERLEQIIGSSDGTGINSEDLPFAQLDAMYAYILLKIPTHSNRQKIRDILCLLIFRSYTPPHITDFESMFDLKPGGLRILFKPLAAVITISDASCVTLSVVHASFPDFLQDLSRLTSSSVLEFACVLDNDMHARLALAWLRYYANISTAVFTHHDFNDVYTYASTALCQICHHCWEANLWNVLEPALQTFDMRLSFPEDLKNTNDQWDRVYRCLDILLWIRSQEHNDTARTLHDRHRQHIESALRGYWSQISPEIQFFLPVLLLHELHLRHKGRNSTKWLLWRFNRTAPGRVLSEIFLGFTDNASSVYSQLKGNKQVHKFVIWAATILIEQQSKNNHPYDDLVHPQDQPGVLAIVLDSAPADLELDAFLCSSERKLAESYKYEDIHSGCKDLLRAIQDYHTKCDQLRTQLRTVQSDSFPLDTPIDGSDTSNALIQLTGTSSERKSISMTATENGDDEAVLSAADGTSDLERTKSRKEPTDGEDVNTVSVDILGPETEPTKLLADGDLVGVLLIPRIQAGAADGSRKIFAVISLVVALLSYFGMKYIFKQRLA